MSLPHYEQIWMLNNDNLPHISTSLPPNFEILYYKKPFSAQNTLGEGEMDDKRESSHTEWLQGHHGLV